MIDPKSLRIGNTVTIENPKHWPHLKGVPLVVTGVELMENDRDFPESTAKVSLKTSDGMRYHQVSEFIRSIPLCEQELIRLGFEDNSYGVFYLKIDEELCISVAFKDYAHTQLVDYPITIWPADFIVPLRARHVHELQNIYYSFKGEELNYKP